MFCSEILQKILCWEGVIHVVIIIVEILIVIVWRLTVIALETVDLHDLD